MTAYKFLASGAVGPFTGFEWPVPRRGGAGAWVEAPDPTPAHGVHACRVRDLAFWLDAELWRAELEDPVAEGQRQVIASRGRLLERVTRWDDEAARSFAEACVWRARDGSVAVLRAAFTDEAESLARCADVSQLRSVATTVVARRELAGALAGYLAEAIEFLMGGDAACSAYICARSAVVAAGGDEDAFGDDREQQAFLLAERLGL
jgi:hypothetical protein